MIDSSQKVLILGLGGAGCSILSRIAVDAPAGMEFAVMDCDEQTLQSCTGINVKLDVGKGVTPGLSTGGDIEVGRRCIEQSMGQIGTLLSGVDLLMVVTGLGGGFGSGAAPVIARIARNSRANTLFFTVFPFKFEGKVVRGRAHNGLRRLRTYADAIVQLPNSRIQPEGDVLLDESLEHSCRTMAAGVIGLWKLLMQTGGVCNLDIATLHTMLRHCDATCRFACAESEGEHRAELLVEELRAHPLAENGAVFKDAPGLIVGITGGNDLRLSEVRFILEELSPESEESWVRMGVASDSSSNGKISAMILAAETWKEPLMEGIVDKESVPDGQRELAGVLKPRSEMFGGSERTIFKGEDLDIPTYLRRKIKLPR